MKSRITHTSSLPSRSRFPAESVLFYDSILNRNSDFKKWSESFDYKISLKSGEKLKTLKSFELVLNKISKLKAPQSTQLTFVAVGGGSVGDFVGFAASVYLRGRNLVHIPSTWLSTVDSAHGGKTGLNFSGSKNQIGSYYPAQEIFICRDVLKSQPPKRLQDALGEIIKIAIINNSKLFSFLENEINNLNTEKIFKQLPAIISSKYKVVQKDPFEKNGTRRLLNLGHTVGHVIESALGYSHGISVLLGLQFSARWSFYKGLLSEKDFVRISMLVEAAGLIENLDTSLTRIDSGKMAKLLSKDKKLTSKSKLDFIFIKKIGHCVRQSVNLQEILEEVKRQKAEIA